MVQRLLRVLTWQRKTFHRRKHPLIIYQTVNLPTKKLINDYAHQKKREFMAPSRDQLKLLKQQYHTSLLSVILQSKEDPKESLR